MGRVIYVRHSIRGVHIHYTDKEKGKQAFTDLPYLAPDEDITGPGYQWAEKLGRYLKGHLNVTKDRLDEIYTSLSQRTIQTGIALARTIGTHRLTMSNGDESYVFRGQGPQSSNHAELEEVARRLEPEFQGLRKLISERYPHLPYETFIGSNGHIHGLAEALRVLGSSGAFAYLTGHRIFPAYLTKQLGLAVMYNKEIEFCTKERQQRKVSSQLAYIKSKLQKDKNGDDIIVGHNTDIFCILQLLKLPVAFSGYDYFIPALASLVIDMGPRTTSVSTVSLTLEGHFETTLIKRMPTPEFNRILDEAINPNYVKTDPGVKILYV